MNFLSRCDNLSHVILKSVSRLQQRAAVLSNYRQFKASTTPAPSLLHREQAEAGWVDDEIYVSATVSSSRALETRRGAPVSSSRALEIEKSEPGRGDESSGPLYARAGRACQGPPGAGRIASRWRWLIRVMSIMLNLRPNRPRPGPNKRAAPAYHREQGALILVVTPALYFVGSKYNQVRERRIVTETTPAFRVDCRAADRCTGKPSPSIHHPSTIHPPSIHHPLTTPYHPDAAGRRHVAPRPRRRCPLLLRNPPQPRIVDTPT